MRTLDREAVAVEVERVEQVPVTDHDELDPLTFGQRLVAVLQSATAGKIEVPARHHQRVVPSRFDVVEREGVAAPSGSRVADRARGAGRERLVRQMMTEADVTFLES